LAVIKTNNLIAFEYGDKLLADFQRAYQFRFGDPELLFFEDGQEFWRKARSYLIELFYYFLKEYHNVDHIEGYLTAARKGDPIRLKLQRIFRFFLSLRFLVKEGYSPRVFPNAPPSLLCKVASLNLYQAMDSKVDPELTEAAILQLGRFYNPKVPNSTQIVRKWSRLRDDLVQFHKVGIF
jgi:hypothetical protein